MLVGLYVPVCVQTQQERLDRHACGWRFIFVTLDLLPLQQDLQKHCKYMQLNTRWNTPVWTILSEHWAGMLPCVLGFTVVWIPMKLSSQSNDLVDEFGGSKHLSVPNLCRWLSQYILQTGWWFGTMDFYDFPYIGNVIIPTDFHIFQRGRYTTNQQTFTKHELAIPFLTSITSMSWHPTLWCLCTLCKPGEHVIIY